jgi:hypothetical protein
VINTNEELMIAQDVMRLAISETVTLGIPTYLHTSQIAANHGNSAIAMTLCAEDC